MDISFKPIEIEEEIIRESVNRAISSMRSIDDELPYISMRIKQCVNVITSIPQKLEKIPLMRFTR